jgi:hypothetical protein
VAQSCKKVSRIDSVDAVLTRKQTLIAVVIYWFRRPVDILQSRREKIGYNFDFVFLERLSLLFPAHVLSDFINTFIPCTLLVIENCTFGS